jgi:lysophospholipase L1-like esterase
MLVFISEVTSSEQNSRIFITDFSGPFEEDFRAFAAADLAVSPPEQPVLFYGSSSIRLWKSLSDDFPGLPIINRGFGGSTLGDCVYHFFSLVKPYAPSRLIFYAGDNDLDQGASPEEVRDRFAELLRRTHEHCGEIPVAFISIKPSPARWGNAQAIRRANDLIAGLIEAEKPAHPQTRYLDFSTAMLRPDGSPDTSLYEPDQLHLNPRGYALWRRLLAASGQMNPHQP